MTSSRTILVGIFTIVLAIGSLRGQIVSVSSEQKEEKTKRVKVDSIVLRGEIFDRATTLPVIKTLVEVLKADSTRISSTTGGAKYRMWIDGRDVEDSTSIYRVNVPKIEGDYIIRVSKEGYETKYFPYKLEKIHKRDDNREVSHIYISKENVRTLDEFTIKTSKVKFYHKGDTLVYNADAFMLPEGSMLDALIAQMPGVEIKDGGKIYVNGRFVESLLLNGKDFFKKNQNVILENIGVYAVKDVAVYEKRDEMTEFLGNRGDVDKEYVMDVRLKKEYRVGTMINAEVGGGTSSRYLGRLFAMRYTDNSRVSIYGNANNINRMNKLTNAARQYEITNEGGITSKANGGIDYMVDNQLHTWELTGNADVNYTDRKNTVVTNAVNYLQSANNFNYSHYSERAKNLSFSTDHNFKYKKPQWNMSLHPSFSYYKKRDSDETLAATFGEEQQGLNENIVKAIYSGDYNDIRSTLINRSLKTYESNGHGYEAQLQASSRVKIPDSPDALEFKFTGNYKRNSLFGNTLQNIGYGSEPDMISLFNRSSSNRPQYSFKTQWLGRYFFNIPFGTINASYEFIHTQTRKNSDIMLLEAEVNNRATESGSYLDNLNLGEILYPGAVLGEDVGAEPDVENSYTSKLYKNQHIIKLTWYYSKKNKAGTSWELYFEPKFFFERHNLFYQRAEVNEDPRRTFVRLNLDQAYFSMYNQPKKWRLYISYHERQTAPDLMNMVNISNTTDPLNVREGNPNLKNKTEQKLFINYSYGIGSNLKHHLNFNADLISNDFVSGYKYNSTTGQKIYKTYNVSGNGNVSASYSIDYDFGPMQRFEFNNDLIGAYRRYSNMIGYDSDPVKQKVNVAVLSELMRLSYNADKGSVWIMGEIDYNTTRSAGPLQTKSNYGRWNVGIHGTVKLPFNFQLNTDFNVLKRFGYIESRMNDVNFIWNAGLEYLIKKGEWRLSLDARDILNQNKGINYMVDATGRTQTLNTILPRYVMLSVHYRFDFKPKKK